MPTCRNRMQRDGQQDWYRRLKDNYPPSLYKNCFRWKKIIQTISVAHQSLNYHSQDCMIDILFKSKTENPFIPTLRMCIDKNLEKYLHNYEKTSENKDKSTHDEHVYN